MLKIFLIYLTYVNLYDIHLIKGVIISMSYIINDKPVWELEAVCSIVSYFENVEEKLIENNDKYGFTKEVMHSFLDKYISYKNAVLDEVMPIFNEKYKKLEPYLIDDSDDLGNPMIVGFIHSYRNIFNDSISDKAIDEMLVDVLEKMLHDLLEEDKSNYNFNELSDIIIFLNKAQLNNNTKMNIINFYIDRYNLSRMIVSFIEEIAPICEKYFFLIEDEYKESFNYISNIDNLNKFVRQYTSVDIVFSGDMELYINIFFLNQLSMISYNGKNNMFVGFKIFELCEFKDKNKYNDTQMVASLKSLADTTRYKVICMLSEKPMYMQEMADKLGLTAANISHHVNMLLQHNIISVIVDVEKNKRIYYELNRAEIANLSDALTRIIQKN